MMRETRLFTVLRTLPSGAQRRMVLQLPATSPTDAVRRARRIYGTLARGWVLEAKVAGSAKKAKAA